MRRMMLVPLTALALAACNQGPSVSLTNASPEEVAKASKAAGTTIALHPGQWETKIQILDMAMPAAEGMPPEFVEKMKAKMMEPRITNSCMTPEEAKQLDPGTFSGDKEHRCKFSNYTMANGKIDATMVCGSGETAMTMRMSGTFAPEAFTVDQEINATGKGAMHSKARVTGKRIGDCPAGEKAK